ncbi:MAG: PEP-utilizing enzyme [Patescibacteria group bacterium]
MRKMETLLKYEWYVEHFDGCPAFTEMTAAGFTKKLYDSKIPVNSINACYYHHRQGDWLTLVKDQQTIGKAIVRQYMKKKSVIEGLYKKWLLKFKIMMDFFYETYQENLENYDKKELWQRAEKVYHLYREEVSMPGSFIDGFMFYADKRLDYLIREFCEKNKIENYPVIYSALSAPLEPSFINEEEDDLKKICKTLVKNKYSPSKSLKQFLSHSKNRDLSNLIDSHLFKYSWIKSNYTGYKEYSFKDLESEIAKTLRDGIKRGGYKVFERYKKEKQKLIKKYKFNAEIIAITKITEMFVKWQDLRKIFTLTFAALQENILKEISRRSKINSELLRYCRIIDLKKALGGKLRVSELKKRQQSSLFIHLNGEVKHIFTGRKAKDFFKKISSIKVGNIKEIKGMTASVGKVKGVVKVIRSIDELRKVKMGSVLVAAMTRPEHLPGMKKAAAIVTDDGGITSHAAIIARELGIPCIIGTKIATKVLKDGQLVEVDANRGVVKIIKKA